MTAALARGESSPRAHRRAGGAGRGGERRRRRRALGAARDVPARCTRRVSALQPLQQPARELLRLGQGKPRGIELVELVHRRTVSQEGAVDVQDCARQAVSAFAGRHLSRPTFAPLPRPTRKGGGGERTEFKRPAKVQVYVSSHTTSDRGCTTKPRARTHGTHTHDKRQGPSTAKPRARTDAVQRGSAGKGSRVQERPSEPQSAPPSALR